MQDINNQSPLPSSTEPIVAEIRYMQDATVKVPILYKPKEDIHLIKVGIQPPVEWGYDLVFNSLKLMTGVDFKIYNSPHDMVSYWTSSIIQREEIKTNGDIYQITAPVFAEGHKLRKEPRYFLMTPVVFYVQGHDNKPFRGQCVDMSMSGIGIKIRGQQKLPDNIKFKIQFDKPYEDFPLLHAFLVKQHQSPVDDTTSMGLVLEEKSKAHMPNIIKRITEKHRQDAFRLSSQLSSKLRQNDDQKKIFNLFDL